MNQMWLIVSSVMLSLTPARSVSSRQEQISPLIDALNGVGKKATPADA